MRRLLSKVRRMGGLAVFLGAGLVLGSVLSSSLGLVLRGKTGHGEVQAQIRPPGSFADLAQAAGPSVVNVSTTRVQRGSPPAEEGFGGGRPRRGQEPFNRFYFGDDFWERFFGRDLPQSETRQRSLGSGFVIDADGYILTNNHVIDSADDIRVKFDSGKEIKATVIGRDAKTDLALIKVSPGTNLRPVRFGDSDRLRVGDWVVAIGNPFGLEQTVTAGIVSAKDRVIGAGPYDDFIQTDASINPGNSGGPLFNTEGEVVGVSTAILSRSGGNIGIGFAIPINLAKSVAEQLKQGGRVRRGWLGVSVQPVTEDLASALNLKTSKGALVSDVMPQTPAEAAGIRRGDIIIAFDGAEVKDSRDLSQMAARAVPGRNVKVRLHRTGEDLTANLKVGDYPEEERRGRQPDSKESDSGLSLEDWSPELGRRYGLQKGEGGVVVTDVKPESQAAQAGIRSGDVLVEIDRQKVSQASEARRQLESVEKGKSVLLLLRRDGRTLFAGLRLG